MAEPSRRPVRMFDTSLRIPADGPRGLPVINNLRFLATSYRYVLQTMAPFHEQPVVPVTAGNGSVVVALGDAAVRQVFTDNATFHRAGEGVFSLPPDQAWSKMFQAVITANGDEHRRRRRLLMPVVQKSALDFYREIFDDTYRTSRFADAADVRPFDMAAEFMRISKTNMLRGLLGLDDTDANRALADDVLALLKGSTRPSIILLRWNQPFTPYGRWLGTVADAYHRLVALIAERRTQPGRLDALSIICNTTDEDGDYLSTDEIAGELHAFFAAGFETTAMTMTWALLTMLASGDDLRPGGELDTTDERVIDAVVKESQRLLPAVPITLPRRVTTDAPIAGSPPVPAGALLFVSAAMEHHNPQVYDEPYAFRPARWLAGDEAPKPQSFFPFGIGARRCLGAAFADLQARVTLGNLGHHVDRLRLLTHDIDYHMTSGVVAGPRRPVPVSFDHGAARRSPQALTGTVNVMWRQ